jgi:hypothetical protein
MGLERGGQAPRAVAIPDAAIGAVSAFRAGDSVGGQVGLAAEGTGKAVEHDGDLGQSLPRRPAVRESPEVVFEVVDVRPMDDMPPVDDQDPRTQPELIVRAVLTPFVPLESVEPVRLRRRER